MKTKTLKRCKQCKKLLKVKRSPKIPGLGWTKSKKEDHYMVKAKDKSYQLCEIRLGK